MPIIRLRPAAPLDRYVHCLWWSQRTQVLPQCEHMLPSGAAQLLFALHETPILCRSADGSESTTWQGSIVHGPQSGYYIAGPKPVGIVVGIAFRPGAAGLILGTPLHELADRHVPLDALWGLCATDIRERLLSAAGPSQAFQILEQALSARLARPQLIHPAVAHALAVSPFSPWTVPLRSPWRVADVQRNSGYSPRHFIALFRAAVGLTPKHYFRIRRFNQTARCLAAGGQHYGELAAAAGYSDQAHLIREFREFAGISPTQYRPDGAERALHHRPAAGNARPR